MRKRRLRKEVVSSQALKDEWGQAEQRISRGSRIIKTMEVRKEKGKRSFWKLMSTCPLRVTQTQQEKDSWATVQREKISDQCNQLYLYVGISLNLSLSICIIFKLSNSKLVNIIIWQIYQQNIFLEKIQLSRSGLSFSQFCTLTYIFFVQNLRQKAKYPSPFSFTSPQVEAKNLRE